MKKKLKKILIYLGGVIGILILLLVILNFVYKTPLTNCMNEQLGQSFVQTEQNLIENDIIPNNSQQAYKELYINTIVYDRNYNANQIEDIENAIRLLNIEGNIETCSSCKYCIVKGFLFNSDLRAIISINRKINNMQMTGQLPEGTPKIYTSENFEEYLSSQIDETIFSQDVKLFVLLKIKHHIL